MDIAQAAAQYRTDDMDATNSAILRSYAALAADVDQAIRERVASARSMGESWASIGEALGITRQAAQQRFGR